MPSFAARLRQLRQEQGMNQRELGAKAGIDPSRISKYESGNLQEPRGATLKKLARALNVSASVLRGEETTRSNPPELNGLLRLLQDRWSHATSMQREEIEARLREIARVEEKG